MRKGRGDKLRDYYGIDAKNLKKKKLFLFDMDGTIYEEERVFDGTFELLKYIREIEGRYVFITNNSSKSVEDYIKKVNRLGIYAEKDNFFTSSQAAAFYLQKNFPKAKVYCQGTKSLIKELRNAGIYVTENVEEDIDVVLVGFDTELTMEKLRNTCENLQKDVPYLATNPDLCCPVSFGFVPDCGAICEMLERATGKKPIYMGKPESVMVDFVREKFGFSKDETLVIGDRLYTDIAVGENAGVESVCVLTGETSIEDIRSGDIKPTFVFKNVKELKDCLVCS